MGACAVKQHYSLIGLKDTRSECRQRFQRRRRVVISPILERTACESAKAECDAGPKVSRISVASGIICEVDRYRCEWEPLGEVSIEPSRQQLEDRWVFSRGLREHHQPSPGLNEP